METLSTEVKEKLSSLTDEQLFNRYFEPAEDEYNPTDKAFSKEIFPLLWKEDKDGMFIFRKFASLADTECYTFFLTTLYLDVLTSALDRGYKLKLENILLDIEKILSSSDNADWIDNYKYKAKNDKTLPCKEFNDIVNFVCFDLIINRAIKFKKNIVTP